MSRPHESPTLHLLKNDKAHAARDAKAREVDTSNNSRPETPSFLEPEAKKLFEDLMDNISVYYEPCESDLDAYLLFVKNKMQLEYYEWFIREYGSTYTSVLNQSDKKPEAGYEMVRARPEYKMHEDCKKLHLKLLDCFYLTQSSRKGITFKKKETVVKNPFAALG